MASVFLLMSGDGSDGNEYRIEGVYSTEEKATAAMAVLRSRSKWRDLSVDEWVVDADEQQKE